VRKTASPNCVNPTGEENGWNNGEATVLATLLPPSSDLPLEKIKAIGMISVGIRVVADPAQGLVPTMV
jgi:hypothetical protein